MADVVNLRLVRKRAGRARAEAEAAANRIAHGIGRNEREHAATERRKAETTLDQHRIGSRSIEPGERR